MTPEELGMRIKNWVEAIKNAITTTTAIIGALAGCYALAQDHLDEKIKEISEQTALRTFEVFRVEDAAFELGKENGKYLSGQSASIRRQNLELVLRYSDQVAARYPDKKPMLSWAEDYYQTHFINGL